MLNRLPGTKENRYMHLLAGEIQEAEIETKSVETGLAPSVTGPNSTQTRITNLENEITELRNQIAALKQQFAEFRKQFE